MSVPGMHSEEVFREGSNELWYLRFLPQRYGGEQEHAWPLLLFLHGRGERGDSQESLFLLKKYGPCMMVEQDRDFPAVVVSPQCPSGSWWGEQIHVLDGLISELAGDLNVDPGRIYLTGLSMGGFGTWHYALAHPDRCAAIVPIAGGYMYQSREIPEEICALKDVSVWAYHGLADTVVEPYQTELLVNALHRCGSDARYTPLADADHARSWEIAYADPLLWSWLFAQRRS